MIRSSMRGRVIAQTQNIVISADQLWPPKRAIGMERACDERRPWPSDERRQRSSQKSVGFVLDSLWWKMSNKVSNVECGVISSSSLKGLEGFDRGHGGERGSSESRPSRGDSSY